jgi:S1-C subfamily serine protease
MKRTYLLPAIGVLLLITCPMRGARSAGEQQPAQEDVRQLQEAFARQSGARLVFEAADLPRGHYHDIMPALSAERRVAAARLALREVQKLPPGYLGAIGLKAIGIFAGCASKQGDGYRAYDEHLKGYRYYGIWNGNNGIAAAFYSEGQLALTFHHEIFHHVDATARGQTDISHAIHDDRFHDALSGKDPYPALKLSADDLAALRKASAGHTLEGAVGDYCKKSTLEDKAETARYLMSHLPDALVQAATRPQLAGSQRLLHVLHKYEQAPAANGPGIAWFVDRALGRKVPPPPAEPPAPEVKPPPTPAEIVAHLMHLAVAPQFDEADARTTLHQAAALKKGDIPEEDTPAMVRAAARLSEALLRKMIQTGDDDQGFRVRGNEDSHHVNRALRRDLAEIGEQAKGLHKIVALAPGTEEVVSGAQMRSLRLLARYHQFIAGRWRVTGGTRKTFDRARNESLAALPAAQSALVKERTGLDWARLANGITPAGGLAEPPAPGKRGLDNPYLQKVDEAIADPHAREAIRGVQPACVRLNCGCSGINLRPEGVILTAGHCARGVNSKASGRFPDGRSFTATCVAFDRQLDLAVYTIADAEGLPFAPLAAAPPSVGTWITAIGQPGSLTPKGTATGYQPFHVSTGHIRELLSNPLGSQSLGRVVHDAWTYWGHSGCPLFNHDGALVALHNSWDSSTGYRRAVPYEAIVHFLRREKIAFSLAQ